MVRTSFDMGSLSLDQERKTHHGIMADHDSFYSYSDELSSSSESDLVEDGSSSGSSSPTSSPKVQNNGPLGDMSSLLQQLPFKRGLSKHFQGKSQSFTSLSDVTCLDDLAKPENPYHKKLKSCKSYVGLSEATSQPNLKSTAAVAVASHTTGKLVSKKSAAASRGGSCSNNALGGAKRNGSFIGGNAMRPPTHPPPHRSNSAANFSNHTPLFA